MNTPPLEESQAGNLAPQPPPFPTEAYAAALREESEARDYAFLGIERDICSASGPEGPTPRRVPVRNMTLRMFVQLCAVKSPFLCGGRVGPEDVAVFLWRLSPDYSPPCRGSRVGCDAADAPDTGAATARSAFIASIATLPFEDCLREINAYLDITFLDAPGSSASGSCRTPLTSFVATYIDIFAYEYSWSQDQVLDLELVALYQLLREIQLRKNRKRILFNRKSDKIKGDWAKAVNEGSAGVPPV